MTATLVAGACGSDSNAAVEEVLPQQATVQSFDDLMADASAKVERSS
jgi:hypothetical protein